MTGESPSATFPGSSPLHLPIFGQLCRFTSKSLTVWSCTATSLRPLVLLQMALAFIIHVTFTLSEPNTSLEFCHGKGSLQAVAMSRRKAHRMCPTPLHH